ncbi:MAG: glycoside hydrolase [Planctomycetaceae bacterium]|nr:glycoside hydrolase [Planctomycetaceae bacterium]
MKTLKTSFIFLITLLLSGVFPVIAQDWTLQNGKVWSRQADALKHSTEQTPERNNKTIIKLEHSGQDDWAFGEHHQINVKSGDVFELAADLKIEGIGSVEISVITRNKASEVVHWDYGTKKIYGNSAWTPLRTKFMVPTNVTSIEPRITGFNKSTVWVDEFSLTKTKLPVTPAKDAQPVKLENQFLTVESNPVTGTFSVTDKRTGREWTPSSFYNESFIAFPKENSSSAVLDLLNKETLTEYRATLTLEPDLPEIVFRLEGDGTLPKGLAFPPPFTAKSGDRLIVPMNEGISYPVAEKDILVKRLIAYGGHYGISMAFWGQIDDATGAGMMAIIETPDDAYIEFTRNSADLLQINAGWEPSFNELRYPRVLRFIFLDQGGHVAICKRYRDYSKKTGLFVPLSEKVKKNPNIDLLLGAANVWYWEPKKDHLAMLKEMKELGMDRILWSNGYRASPDTIATMNNMEHVLTSRYDNYQDVMDPAQFDKVGVQGIVEAWSHDINWKEPNGNWRKGWGVEQKDKTLPRIHCAVMCDSKAVAYARGRISTELETKPFKARFIDVTMAASWYECYHPNHPMTRSDSKRYRTELLKLIGDLGLVCGSEAGHEVAVPVCEHFEGMMSLAPYEVFEAGRDMWILHDNVEPVIERFQVNPVLRLPLWELVYHDCVVAEWYWGDTNNKIPKVWRKRDLLNALYGTPPMYLFTHEHWNKYKQQFIESYKIAAETAYATAYTEMTDHRILSQDRLVQQSVFSNGVTVTVNFGEKSFQLTDGSILNGNDWKLSAPLKTACW